MPPRDSQDGLRELLGAILGSSWGHLGAILGHLGRSSAILLRASNMSPLGGSAEARWPKTFKTKLEITCFKALPKRQRAHTRMASHWACNMSPLGRAGAPALRAESGGGPKAGAVSDYGPKGKA